MMDDVPEIGRCINKQRIHTTNEMRPCYRAAALLSNRENYYFICGSNVGHVEHLRFSALGRTVGLAISSMSKLI